MHLTRSFSNPLWKEPQILCLGAGGGRFSRVPPRNLLIRGEVLRVAKQSLPIETIPLLVAARCFSSGRPLSRVLA